MYNGIMNVYKEAGFTSHDVVAKLRGICKQKKIGHTGTLDPDAVGVLPVCFGSGTKLCDMLTDWDKEYIATLRLGVVTDTQDLSGKVLFHAEEERIAALTKEQVGESILSFLGDYEQVPPMYSALKVNGKKLYELARAGKEVERRPRPVTIHALEALDGPPPQGADFLLRIHCSKGTYVRTLCHDIGQALGCGGCMSSLRRIKAAGFTLADSVTLQAVQEAAGRGEGESLLLPVDSCFLQFPVLLLKTAGAEKKIRNGAALAARDIPDGEYRVYGADKTFLALGRAAGGKLSTVKSFFEV